MANRNSKGIQFVAHSNEKCDELLSHLEGMGYPLKIVTPDVWQNSQTNDRNYIDLLYFPSACQQTKLLQQLSCIQRQFPLLYITKYSVSDTFDKLMSLCDDFVYWPCTRQELTQRINRLINLEKSTNNTELNKSDFKHFARMQLLGHSSAFLKTLRLVNQSAKYDSTVLIEGETGTGKELIARAVHYLGQRSDGPFIPINCGAIPDNLFENEIFGHKRGAYTDANQDQKGLIEQAEHGTLFLDEIEALSKKGQVVLLRFLQDMVFKPLGSKEYKHADIRVVVASNQSLLEMVDHDDFRQDLYFRLNVVQIKIPPLRERKEDIGILAEHFLGKYKVNYAQPEKHFHRNTLQNLLRYNWPGNVRELENIIHRGFIMTMGNQIELDSLMMRNNGPDRRLNLIDRRVVMDLDGSLIEIKKQVISEFESTYLKNLLQKTKGNITKAAHLAGKERRALGKLLNKYNIDRNHFISG